MIRRTAATQILAAALAPRTGRGALVAAGVAPLSTPAAPVAPLDPATELACASMHYLLRKPDLEAARARLQAAIEWLPLPPLGSLSGRLLDLRIAAEMALRAARSEAGLRNGDKVLSRALEEYCAEVRRILSAELEALFASARQLTRWPTDELAEARDGVPAELTALTERRTPIAAPAACTACIDERDCSVAPICAAVAEIYGRQDEEAR